LNKASFAGFTTSALACLMFAATDWYYIREQASGVWVSSATGDPLTMLPALGIALLGISVPLLLQGSEKYKVSIPNPSTIFALVASAGLVTLSTGWLLTSEFFTPGGIWWESYGFPLAWRVQLMRSCPPWCNLPSREAIFNPVFFAIDCLFYIAIGYCVILAYSRIRRRGRNLRPATKGGRDSVVARGPLLSPSTVS
jgi:hypothetical protein